MQSWPLSTGFVRLLWLRALCAVAEGAADVVVDAPVAAVLGDARMSALHGRDGLPRSLASVYGCFVTLFLRGRVYGVVKPVDPGTERPNPYEHGLTQSCCGAKLLKLDILCKHEIVSQTPNPRWSPGGTHYLASDGFIYTEARTSFTSACVYVFTPELRYHMAIGDGVLQRIRGICVDELEVFVTDAWMQDIYVFSKLDGALTRRFGTQAQYVDICFISGGTCVAACQPNSDRISVFSRDGVFLRGFHTGRVKETAGLACSSHNELFISDWHSVEVFDAHGVHLQSVVRTEAHSYEPWDGKEAFGCHASISSNIAILGDRVFFLSTYMSFNDCRFGEEEHWTLKYYELH